MEVFTKAIIYVVVNAKARLTVLVYPVFGYIRSVQFFAEPLGTLDTLYCLGTQRVGIIKLYYF